MPSKLNRSCCPPALLALALLAGGCSLPGYRQAADQEAYDVVSEKADDPRWSPATYSIEMNPRSRYFDPYDEMPYGCT